MEKNIEFLNKSENIIRNSSNLNKTIIAMQSSFRGYLLTNDTSFLDGYNEGLKIVPFLLKEQKKLVAGNEKQRVILDSIDHLHHEWIEYASSLIQANKKVFASEPSRQNYNQIFENSLKKQVGKKLNDMIAKKFTAFNKTEYKLRKRRSDNLKSSIATTHILSFTFFTLTIIVGICSTIIIMRSISRRIKTMVNLAKGISRGEFTMLNDIRKDELTSLSTSLNIMSAKLSKNIKELEKRNSELDKFAYVVSHDLKAPIRGIHNVIKWIEEDLGEELSPEMKKYLAIIPQRTKRMEDLINGLLNYARLKAGSSPERVDSNEMVAEIVDSIVPRKFSVEIKNMPVLFTDRLKLEQVFTNLISNAVKYTVREKPGIIIDSKTFAYHYEFSVKDNGIGIEPEYHTKIFEMFQTLREKDEKESTGIGLAIVRKIIDDMHCTIRVDSSLDNGAEFIFTWPRIKEI
ncbi:MAG TPA: ATP-binding protein [Flavobacteriales bacterium]|nr:ATP-binding protein [Flavobacteriales bacterium]